MTKAPIACPCLPPPREGLDWRALHAFRERDRGGGFYLACLEYAQSLWMRGLAARAVLCLDRAFGAELTGAEPVLDDWPLPYAALAWIVRRAPASAFPGNLRVHFQHYAGRMNEPRREQRIWRAWACWAVVRRLRPELERDPRHEIREPTMTRIEAGLDRQGHPGECTLWRSVLRACRAGGRPTNFKPSSQRPTGIPRRRRHSSVNGPSSGTSSPKSQGRDKAR